MMKKSVLCFMIFAAMIAVANATPIMTYSLVQDGTGATNVTGVDPGAVLTFDILATVSGSTGSTSDGVNSANIRLFASENGAWGAFSGTTLAAAFAGLGSVGTAYSGGSYTAGNKGTDWGGALPTTSTTGYFFAASATAVNGTMIDASDMQVLLGKINFIVNTGSTPGATETLQIAPWISSSTGKGSFSYFSNGGTHYSNNLGGGTTAVAAPVTVTIAIPEPATLVLLGLGLVSLLVIRRRK